MPTHPSQPANPEGNTRPLAAALAVAAGLLRLVPHPFNLTPLGALGLFGGARLRSWHAFVLPLAVMAASDLLLWAVLRYPPFNPVVYASFLVYVLLGRTLCRTASPWRIGAAAVLGSAQFFLITNFSVWLGGSVDPQSIPGGQAMMVVPADNLSYPSLIKYARNPEGLAACYALGMSFVRPEAPLQDFFAPPFGFFGNLLLGDLGFTALLFGAHAWLAGAAFPRKHAAAAG